MERNDHSTPAWNPPMAFHEPKFVMCPQRPCIMWPLPGSPDWPHGSLTWVLSHPDILDLFQLLKSVVLPLDSGLLNILLSFLEHSCFPPCLANYRFSFRSQLWDDFLSGVLPLSARALSLFCAPMASQNSSLLTPQQQFNSWYLYLWLCCKFQEGWAPFIWWIKQTKVFGENMLSSTNSITPPFSLALCKALA